MKLSLVIPCYNEEENIEKLYTEVCSVFAGKVTDYEFVFVDDGSNDTTCSKIKNLIDLNKQSEIQLISFSRNFGKEAAILAGLKNAVGDLVCLIDADLQQKPEVVLEMLGVMKSNPDTDCVTAYQEQRKEKFLMRFLKSTFYKIINKTSEVDFVNGASDFRLMKRNMVDAIIELGEYHRFSKGIFGFVGFNTKYIPYQAEERACGKSKWGTKGLLKYAIEGIVSFTTFPLKISIYVGLLSSLLSVIYIIIVFIEKIFYGISVPGYATIVTLLLLLGGLQLFCLGMLGEYLSKVYIQVKDRPIYILREHIKSNSKNKTKD